MEYTKIVKKHIIPISNEAWITDDLPVKWSYVGDKIDNRKGQLNFAYLGADPGINASEVMTLVDIEPIYSSGTWEDWPSAIPNPRVLQCRDNKAEVTIALDTSNSETFVFKDKVEITFTVFVPKTNAIPIYGYSFTENNEANDKILVVGEEQFYVNKAILSQYSSFFNTLFSTTHFEEAGKEEIELKDLNPEEFKTLLHVIHPTNTVVDASNVEFLWKLSDRFGIASVAQMCEGFFCNLQGKQIGTFSVFHRLKLAELYNSEKLKTIVMEIIDKM